MAESRLDELVEVMAEEGRDYGADLAEQFFEQGGGPTWGARVAGLYDPDAMAAEVGPLFLAAFDGVDTAGLEDVLRLRSRADASFGYELDARRAFLDPEVEAAATERVETLRADDTERYRRDPRTSSRSTI